MERTENKRVAAYARVSTDSEEQLTSYEAQVDYYTRHIKSNPAWNFVEVYADEGISATTTKHRDGFNRMISDALSGKIDLIITKSVSRFARNTVDTLTTVRQLKEKGVEVFFEKENIYTMDSKGELLITIMSSLAQEESRSISENVTWGQRKRFADGKVSMPYKNFLGYEKGDDGQPKIVEKEAEIVRLIFKMFLDGKTPSYIAKYLTEQGIPTPRQMKVWQTSTVASMLKNEKYTGSAILQKTFTVDFLTKKQKVNEGEVPQYFVENSHPAIITTEIFELAQTEFKRRQGLNGYISGKDCFTGKIKCGECGSFYGSKVWHSNSIYRKIIWRCNAKYSGDKKCTTPHIYDGDLKAPFIKVFNKLIEDKDEIISNLTEIISTVTDTSALEIEYAELENERDISLELINKCILENASTALDQHEYELRYNSLASRFENAKNRLAVLDTELLERRTKRGLIENFISELKSRDELLTEFDEELWCALVESVTVYDGGRLVFRFRDGMEVEGET